jgi:hypothetical protein
MISMEISAMATVHFPQVEPTYTVNTTVAFQAVIDGENVTCEISEEALHDHFGAKSLKGPDLVAAFIANRVSIEAVARVRIPARHAAGRALLVTADF